MNSGEISVQSSDLAGEATPEPHRGEGSERFGQHQHAPPHSTRVARLLGPFYFTGTFWYRLHYWGTGGRLHRLTALWVAIFTPIFFVTLGRVRRNLMANLNHIMGPAGLLRSWARVFRTMWNWAWCRSERYERLGVPASRFEFVVEGQEHLKALEQSAEGFIVLSSHIGNFESGYLLPGRFLNRPLHLVREPERDARAQRWIDGILSEYGQGRIVTHFESPCDFRLGLTLLSALRRGELVGLPADRPRSGGRTLEMRLFGRPFPLPEGPATLARAADVPMVLMTLIRIGRRRYRTILCPPIRVARTEDRDRDVREATERIAREVESVIARAPTQWFCFQRVFD